MKKREVAARAKKKPAAPEKKPRGRPSHVPTKKTREDVEILSACGNTEDVIAKVIGVSEPTLRLHYRKELDDGFAMANFKVARNLFHQATRDDPRAFNAIKFWLNTRAGWTEYMIPPRKTAAAAEEPKPESSAEEKLGKKAQADEDAKHPDTSTNMGELMRQRMESTTQ